jgi:peptide deformylase
VSRNRRRPKPTPSASRRLVVQVCPVRKKDRICAPINDIWINGPDSSEAEAYSACSCGRRFVLSQSAKRRLRELAAGYNAVGIADDCPAAATLDTLLKTVTWPADKVSPLAKQGIVPIGTLVLHQPTEPVAVISKGLTRFSRHMLAAMKRADGIGLAANQVGAPVRLLAHSLERVAPQIMINPRLSHCRGKWIYGEGCLSLQIDGTAAEVMRPKIITLVATMLDGRTIALRADEILARVLQHEVDHLDGIEYVQRLVGPDQETIYARIEGQDVDLSYLPLRPYTL